MFKSKFLLILLLFSGCNTLSPGQTDITQTSGVAPLSVEEAQEFVLQKLKQKVESPKAPKGFPEWNKRSPLVGLSKTPDLRIQDVWFNGQSIQGSQATTALLIPIALSLVWLSWKTLHTQPNRNQLFYIGLGLLLAPAGLSLMAVWGFPLLRGALLLELLGLVLGMIWLAFVLRQRAFLHVPLLLVCLGLLGGAGATLIWGHWGLRWGLFILLGLGFMVAGTSFKAMLKAFGCAWKQCKTGLRAGIKPSIPT